MSEKDIICILKSLIEKDDIDVLKSMYIHYSDDVDVDYPYILQKIYIHACLKKKTDMATWLESMFEDLDPISKIAYRHTLTYGRTLLRR